MDSRRISITLPAAMALDIGRAAAHEGVGLSTWLAKAARDRLEADRLIEVGLVAAQSLVAECEATNGPIPAEAREWANAVLRDVGLESRAEGTQSQG